MPLRRPLIIIAALLAPIAAQAQLVRGTIIDSTSKLAVAGAVITVLDVKGEVLTRTISLDRGVFSLNAPANAKTLRVVRIGFRPREFDVTNGTARIPASGIAMVRLPTMLEPAKVTDDSRCPRRSDQAIAYGLWEQARAGLLAAVVAREKDAPDIVRVGYKRVMEGTSDRIRFMQVTRDSSPSTGQSFMAAHSALDFVKRGFTEDSTGGDTQFFGPDADVLLDPGFMAGYCFGIRGRDARRPTQVGLSFFSPDRKEKRIDVDGTVWIDTAAKSIREIEFRYFGLDRQIEDLRPGGTIGFREMPNGAPFIDRWQLNLIGAHYDTVTYMGRLQTNTNKLIFYGSQGGGELAHARWNDGRAFDASLGRARIRIVKPDSQPASGIHVRLAETTFEARTDSTGIFEAKDLVPGPYNLVRVDRQLAPIGYDIPLRTSFVAARDSTFVATAIAYRLEDQIVRECRRLDKRTDASQRGDTMIVIGRVTNTDEHPVAGAEWEIHNARGYLAASGRTGTDGLFMACASPGAFARLSHFRLTILRPDLPEAEHQFQIADRLTVLPVIVPASKKP